MRTYRYFICENVRRGEETTSENDQPYSKMWESVSTKGMKALGEGCRGNTEYVCIECNQPMLETGEP